MSPFYGLIGQNRSLGSSAMEGAYARSSATNNRIMDRWHESIEAEKQRKFQEQQADKQRKEARKQFWTGKAVDLGTSAAGGAILGGMAAGMDGGAAAGPMVDDFGGSALGTPATSLEPVLETGAAAPGIIGQGTIGPLADTTSAVPQFANSASARAVPNPVTSHPLANRFANGSVTPTYKPFAGGNVGKGAALGGLLGAVGSVSGQDYLSPALAMPGQTYARDVAAANVGNRNALGWTKLGLDEVRNDALLSQRISEEAGRNKRFEDSEAGKDRRVREPVPRSSRTNIGIDPETGTLRSLSVPSADDVGSAIDMAGNLGIPLPTPRDKPAKGPAGKTYYTDDEAFDAYKSLNDIMQDPGLDDPRTPDARHLTIEEWKDNHFKYMTPGQQAAITRKLQSRWKYAPRRMTGGRGNAFNE